MKRAFNRKSRPNPHQRSHLLLVSVVLGIHLAVLTLLTQLSGKRSAVHQTIQPPVPLKMVMVDLPPIPLAASTGSLSTPRTGVRMEVTPSVATPSSTEETSDTSTKRAIAAGPLPSAASQSAPQSPKEAGPSRPVSAKSVEAGEKVAPVQPADSSATRPENMTTLATSAPPGGGDAAGDAHSAHTTGHSGERADSSKTAHTVSSPASSGLVDGPARFGAAYLNNPAPKYPPTARRMGEEGKVLLRVLVTAEGLAKDVLLNHSSGFEALDNAALKAVRQWRFIPARRGGNPVEAWVQVPILFKLE